MQRLTTQIIPQQDQLVARTKIYTSERKNNVKTCFSRVVVVKITNDVGVLIYKIQPDQIVNFCLDVVIAATNIQDSARMLAIDFADQVSQAKCKTYCVRRV